jgi:hypothetical protein
MREPPPECLPPGGTSGRRVGSGVEVANEVPKSGTRLAPIINRNARLVPLRDGSLTLG